MRLCDGAKWADGTHLTAPSSRRSALTPEFHGKDFDFLLHGPPALFPVALDIRCGIWQYNGDVAISGWLSKKGFQPVRRERAAPCRVGAGWRWVVSIRGDQHLKCKTLLADGREPTFPSSHRRQSSAMLYGQSVKNCDSSHNGGICCN